LINKSESQNSFKIIKYKKDKDPEKCIKYYEILLENDDLNEELYIEIISLLMLSNDISNAKAKYRKMLDNFKKELGELPSTKTLSLLKEILLK